MASLIPESQLLLSESECEACLGNGTLWLLMRLTLLMELHQKYTKEPMPDASQLAADSKCYECYGPNDYTLRLMELALLRRIVLALDPNANTDPQALLDEAICFGCFGSTSIENLLELAMMKKVADSQAPQN